MRRRERIGQSRFITFSCNKRLPLLANDGICEVLLGAIARARDEHGFELFAWVIMPEHVHLLMRPADGIPLDQALKTVKLSVAKTVIARWRELNAPILDRVTDTAGSARFWLSGGGFDRNVRDATEFSKEIRYIHRNPVERGLVERPEEWKWSSVRWWMGEREGEFPCDPPPGEPLGWARWKGYV